MSAYVLDYGLSTNLLSVTLMTDALFGTKTFLINTTIAGTLRTPVTPHSTTPIENELYPCDSRHHLPGANKRASGFKRCPPCCKAPASR
jgi:hypothetical protein